MKSFFLLKTNVGLTSNLKIMVDSNYNLYFDSIETNQNLADSKFKKFSFTKDNLLEDLIPKYWSNVDNEVIFDIKYEKDNNIMFNTFDKQFDSIYISGCEDITDNKYYAEDYEYFAPLYISKSSLPKYFVIFRIDGAGINTITKNNFKDEILNRFKCVKIVDMTTKTELGQWLYNNITNNKNFPISAFEMDFRSGQFSNWNGIDILNGNHSKKSYYFDSILEYENTFHDLEKFIFDGFKRNNIIFPNIYNFSFLFNDIPATSNSLRHWSINRYSGFYLEDMVVSKAVSTYLPSVLVSDFFIKTGNIITNFYNKPFTDETLKLDKIYIEYLGNFYEVKKVIKDIGGFYDTQWTVICDYDLVGKESYINKNIINIDNNNKIRYIDGATFSIDNWNTGDVWLIEIDNKLHNIQYDNGNYYIHTDYGFSVGNNTLNYFINYPDPYYNITIDMLSGNSWNGDNVAETTTNNITPVSFNIYKCIFSDVKYFDENIVETEYAKFEYDISNNVIQTDETKLYLSNLDEKINPKSEFTILPNNNGNYVVNPKKLVDFSINNQVVNIPSASHYTANHETFRILNVDKQTQDLNALWRKNSISLKWGFKNSNSANDYPYLLNNSFLGEDFNRTSNIFVSNPLRVEKNLDYFYTINSSTASYLFHSLHIEQIDNSVINATYSFDINQYLNTCYDYFTYFFERKGYFDNSTYVKNIYKYSYFNTGDSDIPNITLFKGIKFYAYDVISAKIINNKLYNFISNNNNTFDDYKFSILLSKNNQTIETDTSDLNKIIISNTDNQLQWSIVDDWKYEKEYNIGDVVRYFDILYTGLTTSYTVESNTNPSNDIISWTYSINSIFWSPIQTYTTYTPGSVSNIAYNANEYYYYNGLSSNTFYNPAISYTVGNIVKYSNKTWISITSSNVYPPNYSLAWSSIVDNDVLYPQTGWTLINLWDSNTIYASDTTIVYNNTLYYTLITPVMSVTPDSSFDWIKMYSLIPDTNYKYNSSVIKNNTIYLNNRYYICKGNSNNSTLDNGICIYINNVFKNILINIYINDNTLDNLSNTDRDSLYKDIYSNLTAFNFSNAINDIFNNYGFVNKLKYVIINTDSSKIYDFDKLNSLKNLTHLITANAPENFKTRILSNAKAPVTLTSGQIKSVAPLFNGEISTLNQINFYNNLHLASSIEKITSDTKLISNVSGLKNQVYNSLYRHNGFYEPICLSVDLFAKGLTNSSNSIFDTNLSDFGMVKQLILSKVNRNGSILKLKNSSNLKSMYPQLDEFGYTTQDIFIFKSSWDLEYFIECSQNSINTSKILPANINNSEFISINNIDSNVIFNTILITPKNLS